MWKLLVVPVWSKSWIMAAIRDVKISRSDIQFWNGESWKQYSTLCFKKYIVPFSLKKYWKSVIKSCSKSWIMAAIRDVKISRSDIQFWNGESLKQYSTLCLKKYSIKKYWKVPNINKIVPKKQFQAFVLEFCLTLKRRFLTSKM